MAGERKGTSLTCRHTWEPPTTRAIFGWIRYDSWHEDVRRDRSRSDATSSHCRDCQQVLNNDPKVDRRNRSTIDANARLSSSAARVLDSSANRVAAIQLPNRVDHWSMRGDVNFFASSHRLSALLCTGELFLQNIRNAIPRCAERRASCVTVQRMKTVSHFVEVPHRRPISPRRCRSRGVR